LYYVSVFSVLFPVIAGIILFRRIDLNSRVVVLLMLCCSAPQLAAFFIDNKHDVWKFFNLYTVADAVGWGYIFFKNSRQPLIRIIIRSVVSLQVLSAIYIFTRGGLGVRFYYEYVCLNSLLETVWVMCFFYEYYMSENIESFERQSMFWFCLGILIYSPTTYFLFVFYDKVKVSVFPEYANLWTIHSSLNACMYFAFTIGILIGTKKLSNPAHDTR
jgi:hypothetical protein